MAINCRSPSRSGALAAGQTCHQRSSCSLARRPRHRRRRELPGRHGIRRHRRHHAAGRAPHARHRPRSAGQSVSSRRVDSLWARSVRAGMTLRLVLSAASRIWPRYSHHCFSRGRKPRRRFAGAARRSRVRGAGVSPGGEYGARFVCHDCPRRPGIPEVAGPRRQRFQVIRNECG
jgi:hypothetical protein